MTRPRLRRPLGWLICLLILAPFLFAAPPPVLAATFPAGFADALVASIPAPTALAFTPDGRMLVSQQTGRLLVYRGGALQGTALDLTATDRVCANFERGLLGIAVDPAFASNRHVYLFYTFKKHDSCSTNQPTTDPVNRVSRFVLSDANTIDLGSEMVLIDNMPSPNGNHNAGDLNFGKDGLLYITIGEGGVSATARQSHILAGKVLRIGADGAIPPGNRRGRPAATSPARRRQARPAGKSSPAACGIPSASRSTRTPPGRAS